MRGRFDLIVGITGHQSRPGIKWSWVGHQITAALQRLSPVSGAMSSLAAGADQVFAERALVLGIPVTAVIPLDGYDAYFDARDQLRLHRLLARSTVVELKSTRNAEEAFLAAGQYVAEHSGHMVAVWDGLPAEGVGGTADVVEFALGIGKQVTHIDPLKRRVCDLT